MIHEFIIFNLGWNCSSLLLYPLYLYLTLSPISFCQLCAFSFSFTQPQFSPLSPLRARYDSNVFVRFLMTEWSKGPYKNIKSNSMPSACVEKQRTFLRPVCINKWKSQSHRSLSLFLCFVLFLTKNTMTATIVYSSCEPFAPATENSLKFVSPSSICHSIFTSSRWRIRIRHSDKSYFAFHRLTAEAKINCCSNRRNRIRAFSPSSQPAKDSFSFIVQLALVFLPNANIISFHHRSWRPTISEPKMAAQANNKQQQRASS